MDICTVYLASPISRWFQKKNEVAKRHFHIVELKITNIVANIIYLKAVCSKEVYKRIMLSSNLLSTTHDTISESISVASKQKFIYININKMEKANWTYWVILIAACWRFLGNDNTSRVAVTALTIRKVVETDLTLAAFSTTVIT